MQYVFPHCRVLVDATNQYVETRFPDGTKVGSTPNRDEHSLRVATSLGYGQDTWTMSRDHELGHTWLAHLAGLPWSPTMWRLAHPDGHEVPDDAMVAHEEARVLRFQSSMAKGLARPWDLSDIPAKEALPW